jgi:hypothetical protein
VGIEAAGTLGSGRAGGVVGVEEGVGHGQCPELSGRIGVRQRTEVAQQMGAAPSVERLGQVLVAGIAVADQDPVNSPSTPQASMSSRVRSPMCIRVRDSVQATCTYARLTLALRFLLVL